MASELLQRLKNELERAEADACISLLDGWVKVPEAEVPGPPADLVLVSRAGDENRTRVLSLGS